MSDTPAPQPEPQTKNGSWLENLTSEVVGPWPKRDVPNGTKAANGVLHGEDLGKAVPLSADLASFANDTEVLSRTEARTLLADRVFFKDGESLLNNGIFIPMQYGADPTAFARDFTDLIIDAIPEDKRTAGVIANLDVRPYLDHLIEQGGGRLTMNENEDPITGLLTPAFDLSSDAHVPVNDVILRSIRDSETARLKEALTQFQEGVDLTPEKRQKLLDDAAKYKPGQATPLPTARPEIAAATTTGQLDAENVDWRTGADGPTVSMDSMAGAFRSDLINPETFDEALTAMQAEEVKQQREFPVVIQRGASNGSMRPGAGKRASVYDAVNYLYTQTPEDIRALQKNLTEAGVFDRLGIAPELEGDAFDANTNRAWQYVTAQSIARGTPIDQYIKSEAASYRTRKQALTERLNPVPSQQDYGATLNTIATSVIGRPLDQYEQRQVLGYLKRMETQRSGQVLGDVGYNGQQPSREDDVQNYLTNKYQDRIIARDQVEPTNGTGPSSVLRRIAGDV
jgi:hypothetical protein